MALRTGILGGTFDPIHSGHIAVAEAVMAALGLDRVLLMPSGEPPYKRCQASREDRMRMVGLAARGHAGLVPCDVEIARQGKSYTAETMAELRRRLPEDEFTYILGADALVHLPDWRDIRRVAELTGFAAVGRSGRSGASPDQGLEALPGWLQKRVRIVDLAGPDVSSGVVRQRVASGQDIQGLVPQEVADYIRTRGLYLCDYGEPALLEKLKGTITLHRYHHTLGVADTAQRLAPGCGVDPMRARLAGLLHDCAKSLPYGEMRRLVEQNVPDADATELDSEPVLHAPAGMVLARRDYGVRDPAILSAIRRHTLGGPDMSPMDALIYVSDFIEPGRRSFEGLELARAAAERDIFEAMRTCASLTIDYLSARGRVPHPRTLSILQRDESK